MKGLGTWLGLAVLATGICAGETRTFEGSWNNRKANTKGTMRCTVTPKDTKTCEVKFDGEFQGRDFSYDVSATSKKQGKTTTLDGTANIGGDKYTWSATVADGSLVGKFTARSGNNGGFDLKEKVARKGQNTSSGKGTGAKKSQ